MSKEFQGALLAFPPGVCVLAAGGGVGGRKRQTSRTQVVFKLFSQQLDFVTWIVLGCYLNAGAGSAWFFKSLRGGGSEPFLPSPNSLKPLAACLCHCAVPKE